MRLTHTAPPTVDRARSYSPCDQRLIPTQMWSYGQVDEQRASQQLTLTMFNGIYTPVGYLNGFIQSNKGSLKSEDKLII